MTAGRTFRVYGKVRGVGYRTFARTCARALGIAGWIAPGEGGSLIVRAEGTPERLAEFAFDLSRGARFARVDRVEEEEAPARGLSGFEVLDEVPPEDVDERG